MFNIPEVKRIISHSALPRDLAICTDQQSINDCLKEFKNNYICVVEESTYMEPGSRGKKDKKMYPYYSIAIFPRNTLNSRGDYATFSPNDIESGEVIFMMNFFITEKSVYFDYIGVSPEYRRKGISIECGLNLLEILLDKKLIDENFLIEGDVNHIAVWKIFNKDSQKEPPNFENGSIKCIASVNDIICAYRQNAKESKRDLADVIIDETMIKFRGVVTNGSPSIDTKEKVKECIVQGLSSLTQITDVKKLHILLADEIFKTKVITADELKGLIDERIQKIGCVSQRGFFLDKKQNLEIKPKPDLGIEIVPPPVMHKPTK